MLLGARGQSASRSPRTTFGEATSEKLQRLLLTGGQKQGYRAWAVPDIAYLDRAGCDGRRPGTPPRADMADVSSTTAEPAGGRETPGYHGAQCSWSRGQPDADVPRADTRPASMTTTSNREAPLLAKFHAPAAQRQPAVTGFVLADRQARTSTTGATQPCWPYVNHLHAGDARFARRSPNSWAIHFSTALRAGSRYAWPRVVGMSGDRRWPARPEMSPPPRQRPVARVRRASRGWHRRQSLRPTFAKRIPGEPILSSGGASASAACLSHSMRVPLILAPIARSLFA